MERKGKRDTHTHTRFSPTVTPQKSRAASTKGEARNITHLPGVRQDPGYLGHRLLYLRICVKWKLKAAVKPNVKLRHAIVGSRHPNY